MPTPTETIQFKSVVFIGENTKTKTLHDILKNAEFEVFVIIRAICYFISEPFKEWSYPPFAHFEDCIVEDIEIYSDCASTIEVLMLKEQREELNEIARDLIILNWAKYEEEALKALEYENYQNNLD
jgi:uncharacterized membrane protein YheB (UPF0754 family)